MASRRSEQSHYVRFNPSLDTKNIPELMAQVARIVPHGLWKRRLKVFSDQEARNVVLGDYFDQEFPIERTYGSVHKYHRDTGRYPDIDAQNYELFSFLGSMVLVYRQLSIRGQRQLQANIRGGLLQGGLEPIAAEFRTAVHLMQQDYEVEFTDLEGIERFDLLAKRDALELEIDCKAPSGDVGRKVHGARFRALVGGLMPSLGEVVDGGYSYLVNVTLPKSLHGDRGYEAQLARHIESVINNIKPFSSSNPIADVSVQPFENNVSPFNQRGSISSTELSTFLRDRFGLENVNAAYRWFPGKGAVIFVVKSVQPDKVVDGIYYQLKWSAENQFSGTRPAMLCVQLRDFNATALRNLANASPNGLELIVTRLFSGDHRSHLAGVSFLANEGRLNQRQFEFGNLRRTSYQDVGAAYVFANPNHSSAKAISTTFSQSGIAKL